MRNKLGEYLKTLRGDKPLKYMADQAGLDKGYLSKIELGLRTPKPDNLKKLATAYGADYIELMIICGYLDKNCSKDALKPDEIFLLEAYQALPPARKSDILSRFCELCARAVTDQLDCQKFEMETTVVSAAAHGGSSISCSSPPRPKLTVEHLDRIIEEKDRVK